MAYRYDKDSVGGGLLLYIRDNIPTIFLKHDFDNPHKNKILSHRNYLNLVCSKYNKVYDNLIFMGDFNVAMSDE